MTTIQCATHTLCHQFLFILFSFLLFDDDAVCNPHAMLSIPFLFYFPSFCLTTMRCATHMLCCQFLFILFSFLLLRSYQCPTDSCRIPVIPAESGAFQRNGNWQRALPILPFLLFLIPVESLRSGIDTGTFPGIHRNGMQPE